MSFIHYVRTVVFCFVLGFLGVWVHELKAFQHVAFQAIEYLLAADISNLLFIAQVFITMWFSCFFLFDNYKTFIQTKLG